MVINVRKANSGVCELTDQRKLGIRDRGDLKERGTQSCRTGPSEKTEVFFDHLSM